MKKYLSLLIIIVSAVLFGLTPITIEITDDSNILYFEKFFAFHEKEHMENFDDAAIYSVVDGNTVRASIGFLFSNIKMLGTKAFEIDKENETSRDFIKELLPEHVKISYEDSKFDTFGSLLSYIWIPIEYNNNETYILLNLAAVANGYARVEENHNISNDYLVYFMQAEEFARENKIGLWKHVDTKETAEEIPNDFFTDRKVVISYIDYESDPEYIKLKNISDKTINLAGWRIVSRIGNQEYRFKNLELKPGYVVTLYSGHSAEKNVWTNQFIWNNEGDVAYLYDDEGNLMDIYHIN
ncbi:MAG: lamin tail domain-containing protein [Petrotogales bacterium]